MAERKLDINIGVKGAKQAESVLDSLARKAKMLRKEDAMSGENALGRALGSPSGLANFGLSALGVGAQAIAVEAIGRTFSTISTGLADLQAGRKEVGQLTQEIATGLPLIGPFVAGWQSFFELIGQNQLSLRYINDQLDEMNRTSDANDRARAASVAAIRTTGDFLTRYRRELTSNQLAASGNPEQILRFNAGVKLQDDLAAINKQIEEAQKIREKTIRESRISELNNLQINARQQYENKLLEIAKKSKDDESKIEKQKSDLILEIQNELYEERLKSQGDSLDAELNQLKRAMEKEQAAYLEKFGPNAVFSQGFFDIRDTYTMRMQRMIDNATRELQSQAASDIEKIYGGNSEPVIRGAATASTGLYTTGITESLLSQQIVTEDQNRKNGLTLEQINDAIGISNDYLGTIAKKQEQTKATYSGPTNFQLN